MPYMLSRSEYDHFLEAAKVCFSDYLTDDEWDACLYRAACLPEEIPFKLVVHRIVLDLQNNGYNFDGFDGFGMPFKLVESNNRHKVSNWLCGGATTMIENSLENGREFMKKHLPDFVEETDGEWRGEYPLDPQTQEEREASND